LDFWFENKPSGNPACKHKKTLFALNQRDQIISEQIHFEFRVTGLGEFSAIG
jgi:hypothetical protein